MQCFLPVLFCFFPSPSRGGKVWKRFLTRLEAQKSHFVLNSLTAKGRVALTRQCKMSGSSHSAGLCQGSRTSVCQKAAFCIDPCLKDGSETKPYISKCLLLAGRRLDQPLVP